MVDPSPHLSEAMKAHVYALTASPNGPLMNCTVCTCDAYDGIKHRQGEGGCTRSWLDDETEEMRAWVAVHHSPPRG